MAKNDNLFARLKKWLLSPLLDDPAAEVGPSLQTLVVQAGMNRRKNIRIVYPEYGAIGPLPNCIIKNQKCSVVNISAGGLCLKESPLTKDLNLGQEIPMLLQWSDSQIHVIARTVASSFGKKHFQFKAVPLDAHLRISMASKPCAAGQKMSIVPHPTSTNVILSAVELWHGISGENLVFKNDEGVIAELTLGGHTYDFYKDSLPLLRQGDQRTAVPQTLLYDIMICLANIRNPSPKVRSLSESLYSQLRQSQLAG